MGVFLIEVPIRASHSRAMLTISDSLFPCGVSDRFHHYLVVSAGPDGLRETVRCADGRSLSIPQARVVLSKA